MKPAPGPQKDVDAWLAERSLDPRVDWIVWRSRARVRTWSAGRRVPERVCRARGIEGIAHWRDSSGRCELLARAAAGHTLPPGEFARWGRLASAIAEPTGGAAAAPSTDPEFVLHDLAQLLAHAELELHTGADGRARAVEALRSARELLDAVRTGRHAGARAETVIDLRATLEREARRAAASVPDCGVALRVRVAPAAECSLHAPTFERIVRNLVVNALQASPRGATVSVAVEAVGEFVELVVCDEGRGLAERAATRLFTAGADRPRGRGLGARSVRACVEELAGQLTVRSQPARGTEVRVRLPKQARRPASTSHIVLARGCAEIGLGVALARARARGDTVRVLGWSDRVAALG